MANVFSKLPPSEKIVQAVYLYRREFGKPIPFSSLRIVTELEPELLRELLMDEILGGTIEEVSPRHYAPGYWTLTEERRWNLWKAGDPSKIEGEFVNFDDAVGFYGQSEFD